MKKGHWIILDELNLAPTDVLEALNRVRRVTMIQIVMFQTCKYINKVVLEWKIIHMHHHFLCAQYLLKI